MGERPHKHLQLGVREGGEVPGWVCGGKTSQDAREAIQLLLVQVRAG